MRVRLRSITLMVSLLLSLLLLFAACEDDDSSPVSADPEDSTWAPDGMVLIEAGGVSFEMGSENGFTEETPVHTVTLSTNFWMDMTEVGQGAYEELMAESYAEYTTPTWVEPYGVGDDHPVYSVEWADAVLYCNALCLRDGLDTVYTYTAIEGIPGNLCALSDVDYDLSKSGYRLPTEAQWEFACRGGDDSDFFWGASIYDYPSTAADSTEVGSFAFWYANSYVFGSEYDNYGTQPVGQLEPNEYGLYDMSGNVYEWTNDWFGEYSEGAVTDPVGPETGFFHALRGGSWGNHATYLRSANRTVMTPDYYFYFIGFRTVLPEQE